MAEISRQLPLVFGLREASVLGVSFDRVGSVIPVTPRLYAKAIDELIKDEKMMSVINGINKRSISNAWKKMGKNPSDLKIPKGKLELFPYIVKIFDGGINIAIPLPIEGPNDSEKDELIRIITKNENYPCKLGELHAIVKIKARFDLDE